MSIFNFKKKKEEPKAPRVTLFTSESVSAGHPDKVCDTVADAIKDYILEHDPKAHIAVEVSVTTDFMLLMGEVTTSIENVPYVSIARETVRKIGYTHQNAGFYWKDFRVMNLIHGQSPDINMGTKDEVGGAGDQGIIFGYACNETREYIPFTWALSRDLTTYGLALSRNTKGEIIRPDIKSQVTVEYVDGKISRPETLVVSASHVDMDIETVRDYIKANLITPVLGKYGLTLSDFKHVYINPTGKFAVYGPNGDSGVTGRKLVVDLYGGHGAIGGGSLQGKDPSKVDNAAALMSRYIAKNVVAAGLADRCQVQLAYAIGVPEPVSINLNCFGTEKVELNKLEAWLKANVSCTPAAIMKRFDLRKENHPSWSYEACSAYGWFGHEGYPWENLDLDLYLKKEFAPAE